MNEPHQKPAPTPAPADSVRELQASELDQIAGGTGSIGSAGPNIISPRDVASGLPVYKRP